jgi:hypothetical protein
MIRIVPITLLFSFDLDRLCRKTVETREESSTRARTKLPALNPKGTVGSPGHADEP